ncbi:MAG: DUF4886 domain-containing protein [Pedobacter sp.]|nr:MAG: DUF4886 domain-containing protein [Pedobacter sp.]
MIYSLLRRARFGAYLFVLFAFFTAHSSFAISNSKEIASLTSKWPKDSVVRVLAIGNSFSQDALESYLYGLAKQGGYKIIIGNLYIGGASLELHWKNAQGDLPNYEYIKIDVNGKRERFPKTSISKALGDEKWDFISFQQASPYSGLYETYVAPLPPLFNYVKEKSTNPKAKYVLHQTWAYAKDATHTGFANYGKDQQKMYQAISSTSKKAMKLVPFDLLVPAGTAIQNARTSFIGDKMCRDGYHLDLNIGRYTASCAWYEAIFKESVLGNGFKPEKVTEREAEVGQVAAHKANKKKFKVTELKKYSK